METKGEKSIEHLVQIQKNMKTSTPITPLSLYRHHVVLAQAMPGIWLCNVRCFPGNSCLVLQQVCMLQWLCLGTAV